MENIKVEKVCGHIKKALLNIQEKLDNDDMTDDSIGMLWDITCTMENIDKRMKWLESENTLLQKRVTSLERS